MRTTIESLAKALEELQVFEQSPRSREALAQQLHAQGMTLDQLSQVHHGTLGAASPIGLLVTILRSNWRDNLTRLAKNSKKTEAEMERRARYDPKRIQQERVENYMMCGRSHLTFDEAKAELHDRDVLEKVTKDNWSLERAADWFALPGIEGVNAAMARARSVENTPISADGLPPFRSMIRRAASAPKLLTDGDRCS